MTTETRVEEIRGLPITIVRKPIKNLHLGVYPPDGHVRVAVPFAVSDPAVRVAVVNKLGWIRRQQTKFRRQVRESRRELVSGESHWYAGQRYRLLVIEATGRTGVKVNGRSLELRCRPGSSRDRRAEILDIWYRAQLRQLIPPMLAMWEKHLDVQVAEWRIKRMKTKWASCNAEARRLWFNLELAKKPQQSVEYIVVHELAHLLERHHDARFLALLDQYLPKWRSLREELGQLPLGHDWWSGAKWEGHEPA